MALRWCMCGSQNVATTAHAPLNFGDRTLMHTYRVLAASLWLTISVLMSVAARAQPAFDAELQRTPPLQGEQALEKARGTQVMLSPPQATTPSQLNLPDEQPCFVIREIEWKGKDIFDWLVADSMVVYKQCVGSKGLRALQDHLTRKLIEKGYITSRVLVPGQNLATGRLVLQMHAGRIGAVRDVGVAAGSHRMVLPSKTGDVLNQRDLDQALENFRRLPGMQAVEFDLTPGTHPGETDIAIKHPDAKRWHALIAVDNSGMDSTGKFGVSGVLTVDSPLGLYDLLTLAHNNNANLGNSGIGTRSSSIGWSMPLGYSSLLAGLSRTQYKQTVSGDNGNILYRGHSDAGEIGVGHVIYRSAEVKGSLLFKLNRKSDRSAVDDVDIDVQRRDMVGYDAGFSHRHYIGKNTVNLGIGVKGSLPSLSSHPGFVPGDPDWNGHYRIYTANADTTVPFELLSEQWQYQSHFYWQRANRQLPVIEQLFIGNHYSVRGFDGASTLAAESGWLLRNDLIWFIGKSGYALFAALDSGHVSGPSAAGLPGRSLTGGAIGVRGKLGFFIFEVTLGHPFRKPDGFHASQHAFTVLVAAAF
jgi:hemolysin activation/secretion protein